MESIQLGFFVAQVEYVWWSSDTCGSGICHLPLQRLGVVQQLSVHVHRFFLRRKEVSLTFFEKFPFQIFSFPLAQLQEYMMYLAKPASFCKLFQQFQALVQWPVSPLATSRFGLGIPRMLNRQVDHRLLCFNEKLPTLRCSCIWPVGNIELKYITGALVRCSCLIMEI